MFLRRFTMAWKSSMCSKLLETLNAIHLLTFTRRHIWEALGKIWPDAHWPGQHHMNFVESRL